ncbi:UV radiation resistance associated protein [Ostreococcus tauri]|uniref:UV radiation resistance associated protein n=1 Tax=Ostreococcus tauri TaxID=70448 RepID=A0A1Y5I6J9_OSTTA|nr:UV radiation resistance associated protein [Ostreococcus tauri]
MRARVDDEGSTYAAARTIRHARAVSLRNLRLRGGCGGGGFEKINADATLYGDRTTTRCVIRPYRSSGAVYAPTPYGEVCVDDDSEDSKRWRLVGELAEIFPIERANVTEAANDRPDFPILKIGDDPLDLGPAPSKTTRDVRVEDVERDAAAYGNVAQICIQLAAILDVRLRYPVCPSLSRSYICDFHQVKSKTNHRTPSGSSADAANRETLAKIEFPLFMDSPSDRTRYTYGVFLLNKNLEQLLNAHGLSAVGPRHTLQNLLRLFDARKHRLPDVS